MATVFWEAYQSTQEMYDGCAAAIQYAVEHPQILSVTIQVTVICEMTVT
jgi:hypothetical protein